MLSFEIHAPALYILPMGGGLDENPSRGSAIFQDKEVLLKCCTCTVEPCKRGCFHKSPIEKLLWRGNSSLVLAVDGNSVRFLRVVKDA